MSPTDDKKIVVGISGASGAIYARRLLDILDQLEYHSHIIATAPARQIIAGELDITELSAFSLLARQSTHLTFHDNDNLFDPLASGSFTWRAMVICPCSSHCLSSVAAGLADTLILRTAYVALKQRRPLILVHRETPLTAIDLENMLRITHAGGIICPAAPAFYMKPRSLPDLADFLVGRILDLLHIAHDLPVRWQP